MSIKEHALLVSLTVNKPQMTQKDAKATSDAETANNAHNAGQYRKDLYPKHLVQPILTVESSARAFIERSTYMWDRGLYLLPTVKFMEFADRMSKYELEFTQCVTAFLNNWSNVLQQAQDTQGDLFNADAYPDLTDLRSDFRFRVNYRPVTDAADFRVQLQEEEMSSLREQVEVATKESMNSILKEPLERLRAVVAKLNEVTGKTDRAVANKKTGAAEVRPPIFRDSVVDNIMEEIGLLHAFAEVLPDDVLSIAKSVVDNTPHPQSLRDDPDMRAKTHAQTKSLLDAIDIMLEN